MPARLKAPEVADADDWELLRAVADYQFGAGASEVLFPRVDALTVQRSKATGKVRFVLENGKRVATFRAGNGTLALGLELARRLADATRPPRHRVVVSSSVAPFVAKGGNVFAKHVVDADAELRPGDDVLLVDEEDALLGVGRTLLNPKEMRDFAHGLAVDTRKGADQTSKNKKGPLDSS